MSEETKRDQRQPSDRKILFIGNSYTDQIQQVFRDILAASPFKESQVHVVWGGGATLERLIKNGRALEGIHKQPWDYVILQEQSVRPALSGASEQSFHDAVDILVTEIRKAGAEPLLYMTWGRRDELRHGDTVIFDYNTMQQKLTDAYREAAERNNIRVLPVGEVWQKVREADPELGGRLYAKDGSHPSTLGAFLVSCVFFPRLFDYPLDEIIIPKYLIEQDCSAIKGILAKKLAESGTGE